MTDNKYSLYEVDICYNYLQLWTFNLHVSRTIAGGNIYVIYYIIVVAIVAS